MYSNILSDKSEYLYASIHSGSSIATGYPYPKEKYGYQGQPAQQQYPSLVLGSRSLAGYPTPGTGVPAGNPPQYQDQTRFDYRRVSNLYTVSPIFTNERIVEGK